MDNLNLIRKPYTALKLYCEYTQAKKPKSITFDKNDNPIKQYWNANGSELGTC